MPAQRTGARSPSADVAGPAVKRRERFETMEGVVPAPRDADEAFYREHAEAARRLARHLVFDAGAAEDVAQESLRVALVRGAAPGRPERPWLHGIVRNVARAFRRREGRRRHVEARAAGADARRHADALDDPAALVARAQEHRRALDAVLRLEEPYRGTLILRFLEDFEASEIAALQDVPLATVRTRLRRGLALVREALDESHGGDRRRWTLLLAPIPPFDPVPPSSVTAAAGALVVKKSLAAVLVLLLLGGGAAFVVATRERPVPEVPADVAAAATAETARLVGRGAPAHDDALPPPVPLDDPAVVDRDRDVHGVVVREDGTPVAGAEVSVRASPWGKSVLPGSPPPGERLVATTLTASDGTFSVRLTRGAAVALRVSSPGMAAWQAEPVGAGERQRVVLRPAVRLAVRVTTADGRPVPRADVALHRTSGLVTWGFVRNGYHREGSTDEAGRFVFDDVPGGGGGTWTFVRVSVPGRGRVSHERVESPEQGEATHEVVVPADTTWRGRVTDAATGAPVANAVVGLGWTQEPRVAAGEDGSYALVVAGAADTLFASAEGYAWLGLHPSEDGRADFALERAASLRGRLVDSSGRTVPDAVLVAHGVMGGRLPTGRATARTGDDGRFELVGLSRTSASELWIEAPGFGRRGRAVEPIGEIGARDLGDVVLGAARRLEGRVVDDRGAPVAGVTTLLLQGAGGRALREERVTDDLGRFRFAEVAPGSYRLEARAPGHRPQKRDVSLGATDVADLEFTFRSGRTLVVHVRGPDGERVPYASVDVLLPDGSTIRQEEASGASRVEFVVPADAETRVQVAGLPHGMSAPPATRVPTEVGELTITLLPSDEWLVDGTVLSPEGRPVLRPVVRAVDANRSLSSFLDSGRRFRIVVRGAESVRLVFTGQVLEGDRRSEVPFEADPVEVRRGSGDVVLRTRPVASGQTLRVVVEDPQGRPQPNVRVHLARPHGGGFLPPGLPQSDGSVLFQDLVARPYRVLRGSGAYTMEEDWVDPFLEVVPAGQTVVYRFVAGAVVRGEVVGPDGTPVPRATVHANADDPARACYAQADGEGRFRIALDPERHLPATLSVSQGGHEAPRLEGRLVLEALPGAPVTIRLGPADPPK